MKAIKASLGLLLLTATLASAQVLPPPVYWTNIASVEIQESYTYGSYYIDYWITGFSITNVQTGIWEAAHQPYFDFTFTNTYDYTNYLPLGGYLADTVFVQWTWGNKQNFSTNWSILQGTPEVTNIVFNPFFVDVNDIYPVVRELQVVSLNASVDPTLRLQYKDGGYYGNQGLTDYGWATYYGGSTYDATTTDGSMPGIGVLSNSYQQQMFWRAHSDEHGTNGPIKLWYRWEDNHSTWH